MSGCNLGLFADDDGDTVHDCLDICPGGDDLIDNDQNSVPDACEYGSCCFVVNDIPSCANTDKLHCESPPVSGTFKLAGHCEQNVAIINEPGGQVFIHVIGPPVVCDSDGPDVCRGGSLPPYIDAWKSPRSSLMCESFDPADGGTPIPPGFFGLGSDAFIGRICLKGVSLNDPGYPGADTLIRRHADPFDRCALGDYPIEGAPVPIEIIALSLANDASEPVMVTTAGGNPQAWDVAVDLAQPAPMGYLTATKEHCAGGSYTSVLNVWPRFTFRKRSDATQRILIPPTYRVLSQSDPAPWVHDVDKSFQAASDPCSTFHPGFTYDYSPIACGTDSDADGVDSACDNCPNVANATQEDGDGDGIGDLCDAPEAALADPLGDKVRFISFTVPASSTTAPNAPTALRVRLVSLHHVNPPYAGGSSIPFASFEGQSRWVGPPSLYMESTSVQVPFFAASLQCQPHYRDWSTVNLLHVTGSAIVPSSQYEVENVSDACTGNEVNCAAISAPVQVGTRRWGDVEVPYNPPSTTTQPDLGDVASLVNKFKSAPGAPIKARAMLVGDDAFGNIFPGTMTLDLSFTHIAACVDAFKGKPYPHTIQACP